MEPLDPQLRRIVREGLAEAVPGPEVEARVLAGLLAKLPPEGGGDGGGGGGATGGATSAVGVKAWWVAGVVAIGVVAATVVTRKDEVVEKAAPVVVERSGDVSKDMPVVEEVPPVEVPVEEVVRPRSRRVVGERVEVEDALLAETRGVAEAEAALGRGEFLLALEKVRELAGSHPAGQLRLEREAVEVCARCGLREAGAGVGAQEFLKVHGDAAVAGKVRARCAEALDKNF